MANDNIMMQEEEIDLLKLGKALWAKAWALVLCAIIGGGIAFSYAFFMITPLYKASALFYVNNNALSLGSTKVSISNGDLTAASNLIDTYSVVLKSRNTLEAVIELAQLPYSYEQLNSMVTAGDVNGTAVLRVTVENKDPIMATHIANTIADILPDRIATIVEGSSVQVVDYAVVPTKASSPNVTKITMIGMLIGFVMCAAVVILRFLLDSTIRSEEFLLENYKDIPVLTVIPDLNDDSHTGYYYGYGKSFTDNKDDKEEKK